MGTVEIKERLQHYIDSGDEKLLKLMLALAKEYNDDDVDYEFTEEDIREFDSRREKRLKGETTLYTWEQAKEMITGKKAS